MNKWSKIKEQIVSSDNIVIMTHTNMDGDAIGSASALCHALRSMGKNAVILLEDEIPDYLKFMHGHGDESVGLPFFVHKMPYDPQLAIVVDCGDSSRIEKRLDVYKSCARTICVDHHVQTEAFADYSVVEPQAAATGILVFQLINELGVQITREIAEDLYVAILTDTGCFCYSNTSAECHLVVAELYKYGIDNDRLATLIYDTLPLAQLKLESYAIDTMQTFADGKAVISFVTSEKLKELGAGYDMTGGCIDRLRKLAGTEICAFLKEHSDGSIKLSLRAKSYSNVLNIAQALGGGGHVKASGGTMHVSMQEAVRLVKEEIVKELDRFKEQ